jgi:hypothetical protein
MTLHRFFFAALFFSTVLAANAAIEFVGILATPEKTMFRLTDKSDVTSSSWVVLGETFAGHEVKRYDARRDVLTLAKDGTEIEVRLKDSKVQPGASVAISGTVTLGREKLTVTRATLLFDQENIFPLKNGVTCRITPTRMPDGNIRYEVVFERPGSGGKLEKMSSPIIVTKPGSPFSIRIGAEKPSDEDLGFSFTPQGG